MSKKNDNISTELMEKSEENFEKIKEAIRGLYDILNFALENKQDCYYKAGLDNLTGLYQNLLEMLLNDYGTRKLMKKLRNSELDLDIVLNKLINNQK